MSIQKIYNNDNNKNKIERNKERARKKERKNKYIRMKDSFLLSTQQSLQYYEVYRVEKHRRFFFLYGGFKHTVVLTSMGKL